MEIVWVEHPTVVANNLTELRERMLQAIWLLADAFAQQMEGYAKANAPWNDQTGAARQGLRGFAEKSATTTVIYLVHEMYYGVYLELGTSKMAPRPILLPTLEAHYHEIMAALGGIMG